MAPVLFLIVAFPCTVGAIALAMLLIYRHLMNYTKPTDQRFIIRIIFMVLVYALMSFFSLTRPERSICFSTMREIRFIRRCMQGVLQFVILKLILVPITFILFANEKYEDGNFSVDQAYLYITIIYTISCSMALYALALFYVACKDLLWPFNPMPKFIIIKSVVFLTYWQGVLVFLVAKSNLIKDAEEAAVLQNFIICVEMLAEAVGFFYAFPYKEYAGANIGSSGDLRASLFHLLELNVFYHGAEQEGATKYRSRTIVSTGQEMDAVRKNKQICAGKLDEVRVSSVSTSSSSSPVKSSTCPVKGAHSFTQPYELSVVVTIDLTSYPAKVPAIDDVGNGVHR